MSMQEVANETLSKHVRVVRAVGIVEAAELLGKSQDTLKRYEREYKRRFPQAGPSLISQVEQNFTPAELRALVKGKKYADYSEPVDLVTEGKTFTFGVMSDLHIGSIHTNPGEIVKTLRFMKDEGAKYVFIPGDITEGMSNRPDHWEELDVMGYSNQRDLAVDIFKLSPLPVYAIDGNHDRWFIKSNGAHIVKDIADRVDHFHYCGRDRGRVTVNGCVIDMTHGEDSGSAVFGKRLQKIIDNYKKAGKNSDIILTGHDHKAGYLPYNGVHGISAGTLQRRSRFMTGKYLDNYEGFWVVSVTINGEGRVIKLTPTWHPLGG